MSCKKDPRRRMSTVHDGGESGDIACDGRIGRLKLLVQSTDSPRMNLQRKRAYQRVFEETRSEPRILRAAKGLAAFLREKDLVMFDDDLFAGYQQHYDFSVPPGQENDVGRAEWQTDPAERESALGAYRIACDIGLCGSCMGGHVIAGYGRVMNHGFGPLADAARERLETATGTARDFAAASLIVCGAATEYALRYADRAEEKARDAGSEEAHDRFSRIAAACRWISTEPPRSFSEAVQLFWLTHEIITCEQSSGSLSPGRVDQYLYPYYARDTEARAITSAEAEELIQALWVKLGGLTRGFQAVTLGGTDTEGRYLANDLTYMCLAATKKLRMDQPAVILRWNPDMPAALWEKALDLIETGIGFPALFNDDMAIRAKEDLGISHDDARDYGIVGCVEITVPEKEFSHTEGLRLNWAKVLELMLNGGICTVTGKRWDLAEKKPLDGIVSFDEFHAWYRRELAHALEVGIHGMNVSDHDWPIHHPYPFLSSTLHGCLEKGRDVTAGGTRYNFSSVNSAGMANAVDSLSAIRKSVYQDSRISLTELAAALRTNFKGNEKLQGILGRRTPRYGNDIDETDNIMRDLVDFVHTRIQSHGNPRGGSFQMGLYTVDWHGWLGELTGALPDGHRKGFALANGLSPCQGGDTSGPTAVMKSITKLDHAKLSNGMVLDLKFNPAFFHRPGKREAFRHLVETYFQLGGMEVQFNAIGRETLIDASENPERHRDLIVRVSGFSAYFTQIGRSCQNEIIARTEYGREAARPVR